MDTETIEERSVKDLKEIITRMGGWPVVEGSAWRDDNFKWWDLSMRAAEEGLGTDRMISIGKRKFTIFAMRLINILKPSYLLRLHHKSQRLRE